MRLFIILTLLCFSCATLKKMEVVNQHCNENKEFKEQFLKNVKIVDDFMTLENTTEFKDIEEYELVIMKERIVEFETSLKFISKYAHVSFESMANFNRSYPIGVYEKDKIGWLKWYEENKCKNIQFR